MKLQISFIPETMLDVLTLIIVISMTFGMYILYTEYKLILRRDENLDFQNYNFAQVFIGDKCILYNNINKGILDYNKIKNKQSCLNLEKNISIILNSEKIVYNNDCDFSNTKVIIPIIVFKESFQEAKLIIC
ncbi:MAG: hypothetical protein QW367_02370 [Candidatus Aenigmatarchaeota archaeon]